MARASGGGEVAANTWGDIGYVILMVYIQM